MSDVEWTPLTADEELALLDRYLFGPWSPGGLDDLPDFPYVPDPDDEGPESKHLPGVHDQDTHGNDTRSTARAAIQAAAKARGLRGLDKRWDLGTSGYPYTSAARLRSGDVVLTRGDDSVGSPVELPNGRNVGIVARRQPRTVDRVESAGGSERVVHFTDGTSAEATTRTRVWTPFRRETEPDRPRHREFGRADLSNPDTPRTRGVSSAEFQRLATIGQERLTALRAAAAPTTGLDDRWDAIREEGWQATREEWGGMTVNAHTGLPLTGDADLYAMTVKPPTMDSVSVPIGASREEYEAAMERARIVFAGELANQDHHLGVFRDEDVGRIDIDPVLVVSTLDDVDTIGTFTRSVGGAYHFRSGDGFWPPYVSED